MDCEALSRTPSARAVARLMTIGRDDLSKSQTVPVAAIEAGVPQFVEAREVVAAFQAIIRKKSLADLEPWLERARSIRRSQMDRQRGSLPSSSLQSARCTGEEKSTSFRPESSAPGRTGLWPKKLRQSPKLDADHPASGVNFTRRNIPGQTPQKRSQRLRLGLHFGFLHHFSVSI